MQQALDALTVMRPACFAKNTLKTADTAITALRDRLAQPEQEPVAWVCEGISSDEKHAIDYQQEDVDAIPIGTMLYATPPQRQWVGLTPEEVKEISFANRPYVVDMVVALEAKLKEKNT
jgi:hypothetical protein